MELKAVVIICLVGASSALFGKTNKWNDLQVTWGINPLNSQYFDSLPRTSTDAESQGWTEITECDNSADAKYRGRAFVKNNDFSVLLLFDKNGFIAGMQTQAPGNARHNYPSKALVPPFVQNGFNYYMSAYFTDPATICTTGRTQSDFDQDGTGTDLYLQIGPHPDTDVMKIPHNEDDLADTKWVEGKCFWTMGKHYWYNITDDMSCDEIFPVFLLYNGDVLNAFGWVLTVPLSGSRYEHPDKSKFELFMKSAPKCLLTRGEISTMHVFLTDSPRTSDFC